MVKFYVKIFRNYKKDQKEDTSNEPADIKTGRYIRCTALP